MGSVKDLEILKNPTEREMGVARFHFSNRYSVFDWGEMPDHIQNKGASLCIMGAYTFELAEEKGIKTHYRGVVRDDGKVVKLDELEEPTNIMEFNLVRKIYPQFKDGRYDYSVFVPELVNFLIPLEVIYRNGLPSGSSIFRRLKKGEITLEDLGLDHYPKPGERLEKPILDVSTKLEEKDRYITWREAQKICGLSEEEVEIIKTTVLRVNEIITENAKKAGMINEDGKLEFAFDPKRELMLVDVAGTLDECRFTYNGMHVSKEVTRQFYRKTEWFKEVEKAKEKAKKRGIKDWRDLCKLTPPPLNETLKELITQMYMAAANAYTGRSWFDVPDLKDVMKGYAQ